MISFDDESIAKKIKKTHDFIMNTYEDIYNTAKNKPRKSLSDEEFISLMYVTCWTQINNYQRFPREFNTRTTFTRKNVGDSLFDEDILTKDPRYHLFLSLRYVWEYILSIHSNGMPVSVFCFDVENVRQLDKIENTAWYELTPSYPVPFSWIVDIMPYDIYRDLLSSSDLQEAKKLAGNISQERISLMDTVENIINQAGSSIDYLDQVRNEAKDLGERLTNVKREGNFKLLAKAFSTLRKGKASEVTYAQGRMWVFVLFLILLPILSLCYFQKNITTLDLLTLVKYIPLISLEILFFYFMRLFYIEVKSLKSQLVQIDLRLNLCEFIYDYIETRGKTHSDKVNDSWKAFESLIFSPIQPNEDKIPSVMDGTDVLADLAGKILKAKQS